MTQNNEEKNEGSTGAKAAATTTVLDSGTVEARGMGTMKTASGGKTTSREVICDEIVEFIKGEARASVRSESRAFFTVFTFITRLPGPTCFDHHPGYLMRGMAYFPLAGSLVGIFVGVFFDVSNATLCLPPMIAAAFSIGASLWITGCFHEDGLADASDGIGGGWTRAQILRIMTDTRLGTYGCAVLMLYLVTKLQLLAALGPSVWSLSALDGTGGSSGAGPALLLSNSIARLTAPYLIRTNDYADEGGPKFAFYSFMLQAKYLVTWYRVAFAVLTCAVLGTALVGWQQTTILIAGSLIVSHIAGKYAMYLLGGVMGDYLGATICVTEIVVLTLLLMHESFSELIKAIIEEFLSSGVNDPIAFFMEKNEFIALSRFLFVAIATALWCRFVGHPSVFVGDATVVDQSNGTTNLLNETKQGDDDSPAAEESIRKTTEAICKKDDSTFSDRYTAIRAYLDALAKPMGSLGTLEEWAARLGALQRTTQPVAKDVACLIFAADHGIAKSPEDGGEGCSAYPQFVTRGVLKGLEMGVAGASVLAKSNNVQVQVVDVGVAGEAMDGNVIVSASFKLNGGTRNSCKEPAMTSEEVERLILSGRHAATEFIKKTEADVLCLGEVGIGNTTTSSLLLAAMTGESPEKLVDGGATVAREVDQTAVQKKIGIVKKALTQHSDVTNLSTSAMLARYGGAEIVGIVGAILQASEMNIPVIIDGFIVTVAALAAVLLSPNATRVMFFATQSTERGHCVALEKIVEVAQQNNIPVPASPVLAMQLRMGEATGALLAVPLLRSATNVLSDMATLQQILAD